MCLTTKKKYLRRKVSMKRFGVYLADKDQWL